MAKKFGLGLFFSQLCAAAQPFLQPQNGSWIIGNDLWNITQGPTYGTQLFFKGKNLIGNAVGHYVGYNGENNLIFTSAEIVAKGENYIDVSFNAIEGEFHWVIFDDLPGAYQYFVNHDLPVLGVFRTLFRLDNQTFPNGRTNIRDEPLPAYAEFLDATNVQDETWERADGTYLTKYDWSTFIRDVDYYGVYGEDFGSWYIRPGTDYFNGDHLKQELTVHRESKTGDAVQLNVVHGTHFQASSSDVFPDGKIFGPWLWYLNNGSKDDVTVRQQQEFASWPYAWLEDVGYQTRAKEVAGKLILSNGRPAAGAAVFLGENNSNKTTLDQGALYNYAAYADENGAFSFSDVRTGTYGLYAWSNGGALANITTSFVQNDIIVSADHASVALGTLTFWSVPENRSPIFQIGQLDRKTTGFALGGDPYQHGLVDQVPANLNFTVGISHTNEWYFAQSALGTWSVEFEISKDDAKNRSALLSVALAGFSRGSSASLYLNRKGNGDDNSNGSKVGNLTSDSILSDPSLYRSATLAGEWHLYEFPINGALLVNGWNTLSIVVEKSTRWKGWLWDSLILEWV